MAHNNDPLKTFYVLAIFEPGDVINFMILPNYYSERIRQATKFTSRAEAVNYRERRFPKDILWPDVVKITIKVEN